MWGHALFWLDTQNHSWSTVLRQWRFCKDEQIKCRKIKTKSQVEYPCKLHGHFLDILCQNKINAGVTSRLKLLLTETKYSQHYNFKLPKSHRVPNNLIYMPEGNYGMRRRLSKHRTHQQNWVFQTVKGISTMHHKLSLVCRSFALLLLSYIFLDLENSFPCVS